MNSSKLTILQVITPRRFSGAERMVVYLSQGLQERGHRVVVACKANEKLEAELRGVGVEVQALPISGKANLLAPLRLARFARDIGADIIHTHLSTASLWGSFAGKLARIPVVAEVHALNSKTCFVYADHVVTCSEGVRQHVIAQGMRPEQVEVLYNGLPLGRFGGLKPAGEVRAELGLAAGAPVIGVIAHLSEKKGQRYVLGALPQLLRQFPELVCLLLGEGDMREELERLAEELGVSAAVRFLGFRPEAIELMQAMDVVILPSIAKEGLGLALVEAAFLRKPSVGTACPGIDEVIADGETGLLVPPADCEAIAAAVGRLLGDSALAARMGEAGRRRAERMFTQQAMAARAEEIYLRMLAP